jgi:hypothetical protein
MLFSLSEDFAFVVIFACDILEAYLYKFKSFPNVEYFQIEVSEVKSAREKSRAKQI